MIRPIMPETNAKGMLRFFLYGNDGPSVILCPDTQVKTATCEYVVQLDKTAREMTENIIEYNSAEIEIECPCCVKPIHTYVLKPASVVEEQILTPEAWQRRREKTIARSAERQRLNRIRTIKCPKCKGHFTTTYKEIMGDK